MTAKYKAQNFILLGMNLEKTPVVDDRETTRPADSILRGRKRLSAKIRKLIYRNLERFIKSVKM